MFAHLKDEVRELKSKSLRSLNKLEESQSS